MILIIQILNILIGVHITVANLAHNIQIQKPLNENISLYKNFVAFQTIVIINEINTNYRFSWNPGSQIVKI